MCRCDVILARSQNPRWTSSNSKCMKPMLPRKLTSSARINLNQHWNVLEDLVTCEISNHVMQHGRWEDSGDASLSNEINENLANEMLERDSAGLCSSSLVQPQFSGVYNNISCAITKEQSLEVSDKCCINSSHYIDKRIWETSSPLSLFELSYRVIESSLLY